MQVLIVIAFVLMILGFASPERLTTEEVDKAVTACPKEHHFERNVFRETIRVICTDNKIGE